MENDRSVEPQYQPEIDDFYEKGPCALGPSASYTLRADPRRLVFLLSRYKFVSKMLDGKHHALEIGCGDGFGAAVVRQVVDEVLGIDFDPIFIRSAIEVNRLRPGIRFEVRDITAGPPDGRFDSAYSLDVIEHIPAERERDYMANVCSVLEHDALFVVGTPNITANEHASVASQRGHINLKDGKSLRALMSEYFENVLMFSMNDEVVHTGFSPMAHYLIAVGAGLRDRQ